MPYLHLHCRCQRRAGGGRLEALLGLGFFLSFFDPLLPAYRASLLSCLSSSSAASASPSSLPQLLSASHSTDLYLRSSLAERIRQPVVFVRLSTSAAAGDTAPLSFTCSAEELQDMLAKVKEAVRAASAKHAEE